MLEFVDKKSSISFCRDCNSRKFSTSKIQNYREIEKPSNDFHQRGEIISFARFHYWIRKFNYRRAAEKNVDNLSAHLLFFRARVRNESCLKNAASKSFLSLGKHARS